MVNKARGRKRKDVFDLIFIFVIAISVIFVINQVVASPLMFWGFPSNESSDAVINFSVVQPGVIGVNEKQNFTFNISLNFTGSSLAAIKNNITMVNVTFPSGWYVYNKSNLTAGNFTTSSTNIDIGIFFNYSCKQTDVANCTTGTELSWKNASAGATGSVVIPGNASYNNSVFKINVTAPSPGVYNITVKVFYNYSLAIYNTTIISVRVNDTTIPVLYPSNISTDLTSGFYSEKANYSGTLLLNVSVVDNARLTSVFFISNNTAGTEVTYRAVNTSTSPNDWTYLLNTANLADGKYNFSVRANDSNQNINATNMTHTYILIDNTAPTGSLDCTPANVNVGDTVTCSCTSSDAGAGINMSKGTSGNVYEGTPATTNTGTHTTSCTFTDNAGNIGSASDSYIVEMSSGTGGGGGSGGTPKETHSWAEITPGIVSVMTGFEPTIGVKEIEIEVNSAASNVQVSVTGYNDKPTAVSASKSGNTYQYLQVNTKNLEEKLKKATMTIKVKKSWTTSNSVEKEDVAVFRYKETETEWEELPTVYKEEDDTYYYYEVELTSFSYFAIAEKIVEAGEQPEGEEGTAEETASFLKKNWVWIVVGAVVVLGVAGALATKRKKR